jgi:excisionase family DNA binding protein
LSAPDYESTTEAAARLGLSKRSGGRMIRKWCEEGKLPCAKLGDRWLIKAGSEPSVKRRPERRKG